MSNLLYCRYNKDLELVIVDKGAVCLFKMRVSDLSLTSCAQLVVALAKHYDAEVGPEISGGCELIDQLQRLGFQRLWQWSVPGHSAKVGMYTNKFVKEAIFGKLLESDVLPWSVECMGIARWMLKPDVCRSCGK